MQRFISSPNVLDFNLIARFIMCLFGFFETEFYLTLDRTNWKWGQKDINILMLAIVYKGVAVPVYWLLLNKKGNSSTRERIALLKRFIGQFGKGKIKGVLADREFVGQAWFGWLKQEGIGFVIRIKKNSLTGNRRGGPVHAQALFRSLKPGEALLLKGQREVSGVRLYLAGLKLADGSLLIVACDRAYPDAIERYGLRWQIETLFSCLKGRGFNFEDTHVTDRARIKRLLAVAVIAFCWAHRVGEWVHGQVKPITVKKHRRLAKSLFRAGLDKINEALFSLLFERGQAQSKAINILFILIKPKQEPCPG